MLFAYTTTFSLIEWLALTGLGQGLLILVYIAFRVRSFKQASLAIAYFLSLVMGFALQFGMRLEDFIPQIHILQWASWSMGPPLCYLLVLQAAKVSEMPAWRHFCVLALIPLSVVGAVVGSRINGACDGHVFSCDRFFGWLYWFGAMSGAMCMLLLWFNKGFFKGLWTARGGRERYWLVIMLIIANIGVVVISMLRSTRSIDAYDADALLVTLGIAFIYLATTTLFRVYPPPVQLTTASRVRDAHLSENEKELADKVLVLMERDKLYHEQTFSRADLARELNCSEHALSRVINAAFGKNFPTLLNEYRIEDAKRMLSDPAIPIHVIASEVGFNSIASFNRVFRDVVGDTPSSYRAQIIV